MNILDLIIGIILVLFAISGLRKGLIIEAFYLASFIVGVYGAMYFSDVVAEWMYTLIDKGAEYVSVTSGLHRPLCSQGVSFRTPQRTARI